MAKEIPPPDVQKRLDYHSRAVEALPKWKALIDAGKQEEADELAAQILDWERLYQLYGGEGTIR